MQLERVKEAGKSYVKKKIKKHIMKAVAKIAKKIAMKLAIVIMKAVVTAVSVLIATLGLPVFIALAIIIILGGAMFLLAPSLGLIDSDAPISKEELRVQLEEMVANSSPEPQYRPPFELISAIDTMRIIQEDKQPWEVDFEPIVNKLSPDLTYETYKDTYEIKTVTTRTYEVTNYETRTETYTERVQVGTERRFVCTEEEMMGIPLQFIFLLCYEEVPVYENVTKTRTYEVPVTDTETEVTESIEKEYVKTTKLKTAQSWNKLETFYYKEVELDTEFELIDVKEEGDTRIEIYKRKAKEWQLENKDFKYNYSKFDNVVSSMNFDESAIALLVESLKVNNVPFDNYVGKYFNLFIEGGMGMMVPQEFMSLYKEVEEKWGVPWNILAAIHYKETTFSTNLKESPAGAIGHTQAMVCTWVGWSIAPEECDATRGDADISKEIYTDLEQIAKYGGLGQDGNGDGVADPMQLEDALHFTGALLKENGIEKDVKKAIWKYNNDNEYVAEILHYAELFASTNGNIPPISEGTFMRPATGPITSPYGKRWGKLHAGVDIGKRGDVVPIVAAADGVVSRSYYSSSYGETIFIEHNIEGEIWETVYAHMVRGSRRVQVGDVVKKGQIIGLMGDTGASKGAHLHFELHHGKWNPAKSNSIDPIGSGLIEW